MLFKSVSSCLSFRTASVTSIGCIGSLAALSVFAACNGAVEAIGGGPLGEADASGLPAEASSITPLEDAGAGVDAPADAKADSAFDAGPVPPCPECCAQCLTPFAFGEVDGQFISDDTYLYWQDSAGVLRMPLDGGTMTRLILLDSAGTIKGFAIDSTSIYWSDINCSDGGLSCPPNEAGNVHRAPIDGGARVNLASGIGFPDYGLAIDATHAYWTDEAAYSPGNAKLKSVPLDGGAVSVLASTPDGVSPFNYVGPLSVRSDRLYWIDDGWGCGEGIKVINPQPCVLTVSIDGGTPAVYAKMAGNLLQFGVQDGDVEWVTQATTMTGSSSIAVSGTDDGGPPSEVGSTPVAADNLAWDSTNLYWSLNGTILKTPRNGGATTRLAVGQNSPGSFFVTPTSLYWYDAPTSYQAPYPTNSPASGAIMRLSPK